MTLDAKKVAHIVRTVPSRYRGPGGAIAVLKEGALIDHHVWGYADMDKRIPMTPQVLLPICSITKQFVSMLLLDLVENPPPTLSDQQGNIQEQMLSKLREILSPTFVDESDLTVDNLVDMCSGLRDYWALCTLQGSRPDSPYSIQEHNSDMLRRLKSLQFQPGTEYSYSNTNFNVVERLIEHVTNDSLENLLTERIFRPAKMDTARMCPRTDRLPPPIIGYEGTEKSGFFPAPNAIEWSADAGLAAALNDMIAYERYFDSKYTDPQCNYRQVVQPRKYKDGSMACYRYGLRHSNVQNFATVGHGGALRGFALHRRYVESERLSVVVLFNHSASASEASEYIIKQILNIAETSVLDVEPVKAWFGSYFDQDTQLSVRVRPDVRGKIKIHYSRKEETLKLVSASRAETPDIEAWMEQDSLHIRRLEDNRVLNPIRLTTEMASASPVQGSYHCSETESTFICAGEGKMLYGMFDGCFGRGPPHLMTHLGQDIWVLADPRAMDDTAPGDWTIVFVRDEQGAVVEAVIGCWLARKLKFSKI